MSQENTNRKGGKLYVVCALITLTLSLARICIPRSHSTPASSAYFLNDPTVQRSLDTRPQWVRDADERNQEILENLRQSRRTTTEAP